MILLEVGYEYNRDSPTLICPLDPLIRLPTSIAGKFWSETLLSLPENLKP